MHAGDAGGAVLFNSWSILVVALYTAAAKSLVYSILLTMCSSDESPLAVTSSSIWSSNFESMAN